MSDKVIMTNRAPVLALWAAVVAEHLGYEPEAALTLGKAVAGLNAQTKGRTLGIFSPPKSSEQGARKKAGLGEEFWIAICGRPVPAKNTENGVRAVVKDRPIDPETVARYLEQKFGDDLDALRDAMKELATSYAPDRLERIAYSLYEQFRPSIPKGKQGWGAKGALSLSQIRSLADRASKTE
jgi:hypothetical protein